jgi:hypothetical protein
LVGYTTGQHAKATAEALAWLAQIANELGPYPDLPPPSVSRRASRGGVTKASAQQGITTS